MSKELKKETVAWLNSILPQIFPDNDPHSWGNIKKGNLGWDIKTTSEPFYRNLGGRKNGAK